MERDVALEVRDIHHSFGGQVTLDGVSLEVGCGEAVALIGPNGCGKSTLLRIINGLEWAATGTVAVEGRVVDATTMADRAYAKSIHQRMGFVFQNPDTQLFCPSVAEEICFGPRQMGLPNEEVERRLADCLSIFGLEHLADRAPYHLSGGERHKVAIACIVSMAPSILVLDEPTTGLDEASEDTVVAFLNDYVAAGHSVLVTTHHPCLASEIGARVVRMDAEHHVVG